MGLEHTEMDTQLNIRYVDLLFSEIEDEIVISFVV